MKTLMKLVAAAALTAAPLAAFAADVAAGQKIADAQCAACHGKDGKTPTDPSYPKLAGQYADYLAVSLQAYQNGERKNAIMAGIAKPLSRRDIENLAAYFSSLPGPLTHRR
ncbi:MAG: c-type cytochrome [Betaproteobacteria bacterium]|jgi:cytochrome c553